jgi:hypothetical protein
VLGESCRGERRDSGRRLRDWLGVSEPEKCLVSHVGEREGKAMLMEEEMGMCCKADS